MEDPTAPMKTEAVSAGFYESALKMKGGASEKFPRIQILTIEELLLSKKLAFPRHVLATFRQAVRKSKGKERQTGLFRPS